MPAARQEKPSIIFEENLNPPPPRKQSQTLNMNLDGERLDENILIEVVSKWQLNFYQLNNQNKSQSN